MVCVVGLVWKGMALVWHRGGSMGQGGTGCSNTCVPKRLDECAAGNELLEGSVLAAACLLLPP